MNRGRGEERKGKSKREGKGDPVGIHQYFDCSSFITYVRPPIKVIYFSTQMSSQS